MTVCSKKRCKFKVYHTNRHWRPARPKKTNHSPSWNGACLDTGTQRTIIGLAQAKAYCRFSGNKFKPKPSPIHFRFGNDSQASIRTMNIFIPIPDGYIICEKVDIVRANVPFLIGLDLLDKYHMFIDSVNNMLRSPKLRLDVPPLRKLGQIYLEWDHPSKTHLTEAELVKLHRGFPIQHQRNSCICSAWPALFKLMRPPNSSCSLCKLLVIPVTGLDRPLFASKYGYRVNRISISVMSYPFTQFFRWKSSASRH